MSGVSGGFDGLDLSVGQEAMEHCGIQHARWLDLIHIGPLAGQVPRV